MEGVHQRGGVEIIARFRRNRLASVPLFDPGLPTSLPSLEDDRLSMRSDDLSPRPRTSPHDGTTLGTSINRTPRRGVRESASARKRLSITTVVCAG